MSRVEIESMTMFPDAFCLVMLEVYVSFVRRKIKAIESKVVIKAVRGVGYRMEVQE